jgi:hypothetical protein
MLLSIGTVGYLELEFWHTHDDRRHRHDLAVADPEAHQLSHRLDGRKAGSRSVLRED